MLRGLVNLAYKQVADRLGDIDTVRTHVHRALPQTQVHSVAKAVGRALRERLRAHAARISCDSAAGQRLVASVGRAGATRPTLERKLGGRMKRLAGLALAVAVATTFAAAPPVT